MIDEIKSVALYTGACRKVRRTDSYADGARATINANHYAVIHIISEFTINKDNTVIVC